jgi:hypothetical protein
MLDTALQHRSVTVPSDEAICAATLMKVELEYVLEDEDQKNRMARFWERVARDIGIPAKIIFFEDNRLHLPGWGWAPLSLLSSTSDPMLDSSVRTVRWTGAQIGKLSEKHGLRVQFPGFLLSPKTPRVPLPPWHGSIRMPESHVYFQGTENGQWHRLANAFRAHHLSRWTDAELKEYDEKYVSPLSQAVQEGGWAVILHELWENTRRTIGVMHVAQRVGVLVKIIDSIDEPGFTKPSHRVHLRASVPTQVILSSVNEYELLILETVKRLAEELRSEAITKTLLDILDRESQEYKQAWESVKHRMKELMNGALETQKGLKEATYSMMGENREQHMWVLIAGWFAHDNAGKPLADDQVWYVDGDPDDMASAASANQEPQN